MSFDSGNFGFVARNLTVFVRVNLSENEINSFVGVEVLQNRAIESLFAFGSSLGVDLLFEFNSLGVSFDSGNFGFVARNLSVFVRINFRENEIDSLVSVKILQNVLSNFLEARFLAAGFSSAFSSAGFLAAGFSSELLAAGFLAAGFSSAFSSAGFLAAGFSSELGSAGFLAAGLLSSELLAAGFLAVELLAGLSSEFLAAGFSSELLAAGFLAVKFLAGFASELLAAGLLSSEFLAAGLLSSELLAFAILAEAFSTLYAIALRCKMFAGERLAKMFRRERLLAKVLRREGFAGERLAKMLRRERLLAVKLAARFLATGFLASEFRSFATLAIFAEAFSTLHATTLRRERLLAKVFRREGFAGERLAKMLRRERLAGERLAKVLRRERFLAVKLRREGFAGEWLAKVLRREGFAGERLASELRREGFAGERLASEFRREGFRSRSGFSHCSSFSMGFDNGCLRFFARNLTVFVCISLSEDEIYSFVSVKLGREGLLAVKFLGREGFLASEFRRERLLAVKLLRREGFLASFGSSCFTSFKLLLHFSLESIVFSLGQLAVFVCVDAIEQTCQELGVLGQFILCYNAVFIGVELQDGEIAMVAMCRSFRSCRCGFVGKAHKRHCQNCYRNQKQFLHQNISLKRGEKSGLIILRTNR